MHQTHQVVFLLFDGHLTAIFDATKLSQFLVLLKYRLLKHGVMQTCVNALPVIFSMNRTVQPGTER